MAITKYVFTGTTITAQASEMLTWLQANATDFFDSISMASNVITCSKGSVNALVLSFDGKGNNITMCLANGASVKSDSVGSIFRYAIKTSTGILLKNDGKMGVITFLFVTKTNNDELAFASTIYAGNYGHFFMGDVFHSSKWDDMFGGIDYMYDSNYYPNYWGFKSSLTTLTPLCIKQSASYTPDLNFMRFCEFPQIESKISIGGVEYYSNGYLALKG